jgi:uncharacterized protein YukJ
MFDEYRGHSPGDKADQSPPTKAEAKNTWIHISTAPIRLHALVKYRDNFTVVFTTFVVQCLVTHSTAGLHMA